MTKKVLVVLFIGILTLLTACSSGRYQQQHDSIPTRVPNAAELTDAIPRAEPYSRGGNKDYEVFGKPYQVMSDAKLFEQTGTASWYGGKFHGHYTSNGEIYDMYSMSAAHKNLPLPTYLKVTNLANNKSVIVRVNDRGPFHSSRIIDLSYSAAYKLDMLKTGTAEVKIMAITHLDAGSTLSHSAKTNKKNTLAVNTDDQIEIEDNMGLVTPYIQVFATSKQSLAKETAKTLENKYKQKTSYHESANIYRIQMGPISDIASLNALLAALKKDGYPNAFPKSLPK